MCGCKETPLLVYFKPFSEELNWDLPVRADEGASGYDIRSSGYVEIKPNSVGIVPTNISVEIPTGYEAQVRSRSGLATKGIFVLNSPGTIDSSYRGEIKVILFNTTSETFTVTHGMKIAQLVFAEVCTVEWRQLDNLSDTSRGENGFGSTGV